MNINKEKIDIEKLLKTSSGDVDMMILLGEKSQLACRLIAHKLTGEALIKRQEKLRREAKKSGKKKVQQVCTEIDNWSIYITNLKQETGQEIHNLYRLRWQIELLFKALKSKLSMGEIKDKNEHKAMMMIYGKLIVYSMKINNCVVVVQDLRYSRTSVRCVPRLEHS